MTIESKITFIDGEKGILEYRGYNIEQLAKLQYNKVAYLLLFGKLPNRQELENFSFKLNQEMSISDEVIQVLSLCPGNIDAMDALRTGTSFLAHYDPDLENNSRNANMRKAFRIIAKLPTIVAAYHRIKSGQKPIVPNPNLSRGANFLYMLTGERPTEIEAKQIETDFVLTAEHGLNASTFSSRVTSSTLSDLHSSIISALGTLKGPIHGGARKEVMKMLDEIGKPEKAEKYVLDKISKKEKIMGFGHRVYKTYDPRARIFKQLTWELAREKNNTSWYNLGLELERVVHDEFVNKKGKQIYPNVDFWVGIIYKYLNIAPELATAMFALGRVTGWIAHCLEQCEDNRLIRPRATYTGYRERKI